MKIEKYVNNWTDIRKYVNKLTDIEYGVVIKRYTIFNDSEKLALKCRICNDYEKGRIEII